MCVKGFVFAYIRVCLCDFVNVHVCGCACVYI